MRDCSVIEINLSDLDHNVRILREMAGPQTALCPIVKADAYGLGAGRVAKRLADVGGAELLAVYTPEQAAELFRVAVSCPVLVLMPVREIARADEVYRALISDRLQLTVHDMAHVSDLITVADRYAVTVPVHLEIDTGMSRGGCSLAEAGEVLERIAAHKRLKLVGLFTHFARAESDVEFTEKQYRQFDAFMTAHARLIPPHCRIHVASTFAALRSPRYHRSMIRVGLAWAGYGVEWLEDGEVIPSARKLRPILTWRSQVVHIKSIDRGTPVGYGSSWVARRKSIVGLVPVGYADGYPTRCGGRDRHKGGSLAVLGDDAAPLGFAPVIGAVNMDQITIDLTDIAAKIKGAGMHLRVGTAVELISPQAEAPNHLPKLARLAGTIPHELLCGLNPRIRRIYTGSVNAIERPLHARPLVG